MSGTVFRLVLLVSCAHAMVHVYELSLPAVEQRVAADYYGDDVQAGKELTGSLSFWWRLPWGLGALLAGWLVDGYGAKRMLALYLLGCAATCLAVGLPLPLPLLFVTMFSMGSFASIYHPAGLALISHETSVENRPRALGTHGIFGSLGIGLAPLLAGLALSAELSWRQYYLLLTVPGVLLGAVFAWQGLRRRVPVVTSSADKPPVAVADSTDWISFYTLTALALMQGLIYSGLFTFLPRYLSDWQPSDWNIASVSVGNYFASGVLLAGCAGQYLAGRIARHHLLECQLTLVTLANIPLLLWMAVAENGQRPVAATLFAMVHFMHQPLYNSLIAKYSPRSRRSLCYGFSFAMGLGVGGVGAYIAGQIPSEQTTHYALAGIALIGGAIGAVLWVRNAE